MPVECLLGQRISAPYIAKQTAEQHLRGNHFEQILPLDAYYTLGTQNWKCSGGTTFWAIS